MGVEYDGNAYNGWQKQNVGIGIQLPSFPGRINKKLGLTTEKELII